MGTRTYIASRSVFFKYLLWHFLGFLNFFFNFEPQKNSSSSSTLYIPINFYLSLPRQLQFSNTQTTESPTLAVLLIMKRSPKAAWGGVLSKQHQRKENLQRSPSQAPTNKDPWDARAVRGLHEPPQNSALMCF